MSPRLSIRAVAAACAFVLAPACDRGGADAAATSTAPEAGIGTVVVLPATCTGGIGVLPATTCQRLRVEATGLAPLEVELRISEPAGGVAPVGTVVLGTGGVGTDFYADIAGGDVLALELLSLGFRVVDRRWANDWFVAGEGILEQSARYATLLTWIHANLHTVGVFGATGNSAGAGEIAYALAAWGLGDRLDVAVLSGGPPFTRLDYFCEVPPSAEWDALCTAAYPAGELDCLGPTCTPEPMNPLCPVLPTNPEAGELLADSLLFPGATLDFPSTALHGVFGTRDCTSAVPMGIVFFEALTSPFSLTFADGAAHTTTAHPNGRAAIVQGLTSVLPPTSAAAEYVRLTIRSTPYATEITGTYALDGEGVRLVGLIQRYGTRFTTPD